MFSIVRVAIAGSRTSKACRSSSREASEMDGILVNERHSEGSLRELA